MSLLLHSRHEPIPDVVQTCRPRGDWDLRAARSCQSTKIDGARSLEVVMGE